VGPWLCFGMMPAMLPCHCLGSNFMVSFCTRQYRSCSRHVALHQTLALLQVTTVQAHDHPHTGSRNACSAPLPSRPPLPPQLLQGLPSQHLSLALGVDLSRVKAAGTGVATPCTSSECSSPAKQHVFCIFCRAEEGCCRCWAAIECCTLLVVSITLTS
jgi:hypothetical protein